MARKPAADNEGIGIVDRDAMARAIDLSVQGLTQLADRGIAMRVGRGRYALFPTILAYIRHLREQAAGRVGLEGADSVKANVNLRTAQEELIRLRIARESGAVVSIAEVDAAWAEVMLQVRQTVLSIPGRMRFGLPHLTSHDQKVLTEICHDILTEVAEGRAPVKAQKAATELEPEPEPTAH